jgi:hypothetical protein
MEPILAFIMPLSTGGVPTPPIASQPPGIWPSPGHPSHPISPGGGPSQGPGFPTFPIAPGGPPPQVWPGPGRPDQGLPGQPPFPSQGPGFPTPPIYIPIQPPPDSGLAPEQPVYFPVFPGNPIANVPTWQDIKNFIFGNPPQTPSPSPTS